MKTPPATRYINTDRSRILNFVQSLEITKVQEPYVTEIFKKSSFSAKDLKVLIEIVASKAQISSVQLANLGLPTIPNAVQQEMAQ